MIELRTKIKDIQHITKNQFMSFMEHVYDRISDKNLIVYHVELDPQVGSITLKCVERKWWEKYANRRAARLKKANRKAETAADKRADKTEKKTAKGMDYKTQKEKSTGP